ncbi:uncharacterized protein LAESUDRAFT_686826 [Laetiporus sulphureus 93-53]|uniref:Uncharacterized protein n=1 Tax=Laetiporus sulphureus 93-53 TaxID=1314785 RepID=A0A165BMZ8_9APHY|nr:uncharacterized protein LAESUDRAFT_686826 [Laetiporus sulphureus 93-53]KZT01335.1 hypothetical protein LAESUDRAFT_686826 [Laetiporus sulphureus 93-53]
MIQEPLVSVNLATVSMEAFFYGIFFVLSTTSIYLLVLKQRASIGPLRATPPPLHRNPMFIGAIALSTTITAHWILTVTRSFDAFVYHEGGSNPIGFFGNLKQTTEVVKTGFIMATLVIGDSMVIYRLWIIWNYRSAVIIFPLCTLVGLTVCGVGITYQFSQYDPGEDVFLSAAGRWITSDCVFTLCTNVYSSFMITLRVWRSYVSIRNYAGANLLGVLATIIESAALYTSWTIFFFVTYQTGSNLQFTAVDTFAVISGISFMLINVRVGLGWAHLASQGSVQSHSGAGHNQQRSVESQPYPMKPLAVNISTVVHQEDEYTVGNGKCSSAGISLEAV